MFVELDQMNESNNNYVDSLERESRVSNDRDGRVRAFAEWEKEINVKIQNIMKRRVFEKTKRAREPFRECDLRTRE